MIISGEFVWIWYWSTYISVLKALNLTEVSTIHTWSKQYVFNKIWLTHFHVCIQKCGKQSPRCPYQSRKPWKFMPNKWTIFQIFLAFDFFSSAWSFVFSSPPQQPMTSNFEGFLSQILYIILYYLYSSEGASISLFNVNCQTRELPGTIFITSLVWRGPWVGIEPETSRTRCQHSTTRLSRRR